MKGLVAAFGAAIVALVPVAVAINPDSQASWPRNAYWCISGIHGKGMVCGVFRKSAPQL
jgi:hypothetical protein